jgi:hypothetical protein
VEETNLEKHASLLQYGMFTTVKGFVTQARDMSESMKPQLEV